MIFQFLDTLKAAVKSKLQYVTSEQSAFPKNIFLTAERTLWNVEELKYLYSGTRPRACFQQYELDAPIFPKDVLEGTPRTGCLGVISSNFNTFFADILRELQVGYQGHVTMPRQSHTLL